MKREQAVMGILATVGVTGLVIAGSLLFSPQDQGRGPAGAVQGAPVAVKESVGGAATVAAVKAAPGADPTPTIGVSLTGPGPIVGLGEPVVPREPMPAGLNAGKVAELHMGGVALGTVLQLLSTQAKTELKGDWPELEKHGIQRDTLVTVDAKNVSMEQTLQRIVWGLQPTSGTVWYHAENNAVVIGIEEKPSPPQTEAIQRRSEEIARNMKAPLNLKTLPDAESTIDTIIGYTSMANDVALVPDWAALEKAGVTREMKTKIVGRDQTVGAFLEAQLSSLNAKEPLGYKIVGPVVRISTKAALERK